jgi:NAD(P)-dependent dehydrogenase (short-subunit alcohol dehydrogenase family)
MRFSGRHIVVSGAGSGIGRAISLRLAREGAQLSLLARNEARLKETAASIVSAGGLEPCIHTADIRLASMVERAFAHFATRHGPIHALIANSGIGGPNAPASTQGGTDRFEDLVATNLTGTYHCLRAAQAHLAASPATRHMIVIASILARLGVTGYTGYCASKAGLCGLVRALAVELAPQNVQVNAVLPGWVETAMALEGLQGMASGMKTTVEEARRIALSAVPLGRMGQPEDVAGMIAWLLSDDARGVTGACLDINNGAIMS